MLEPILENRISKDFINTLPPLRFRGHIELINRPDQIRKATRHLRRHRVLGFDTESRPAFKKGESYPVSLIQLATPDTVYLFHLTHIEIDDRLAKILASKRIKKVGIALNNDLDKLSELRPMKAAGFVDLSRIASEKGIVQQGARSLAARYLHQRLIKSSQRTNWARRELTEKQKLYAATDAWVCLEIYFLLLADNRTYLPPTETDTCNENGEASIQ
ncbi:MAG TPA: 3'-5' exonuclease domain-containing protein 2 [Candidatus Aminicenantes bacterium]|nr:3'-5' exonuclease domain-containing protein 2 [Candidatus Aminicenantes bacterium]